MKKNLDYLEKLVKTPSPSGDESKCQEVFCDFMSSIEDAVPINAGNGILNKAFRIGSETKPTILLSGHIDNIAMMITEVTSSGKLRFIKQGGIDKKAMIDQSYMILTSKGTVPAIISKKAIHLETTKERDMPNKLEDLLLDVGAEKKEDIIDMGISIGDLVIPDPYFNPKFGYKERYIVSTGLDDKIAIYIISEVAKKFERLENFNLTIASFAQEEVGLRGATVGAKIIAPDISIDIDLTHVTDEDTKSSNPASSSIKFGKGVVIQFGPDKNRDLVNELIKVAKDNDIKYQLESTLPGGTNCDAIQMNNPNPNSITAHLGIPELYMHTNHEKVCWSDVESCIKLLIEWLKTK